MDHDDPAPAPPRTPLHRSTHDRYLGGVAGGLGERFDTDPGVFRLCLVGVATYLAFGLGQGEHILVLFAYGALWVLLPTTDERALLARPSDPAARRELLLAALVVVGGSIVLDDPGSLAVLVLGGVAALLLRSRPPAPTPTTADDTDGTDAAPAASRTRVGPAPATTAPTRADWRPFAGLRPPAIRRPRREPALWPLTAGLLVLLGAVALGIDQASDGVDPRIVVDLALIVIGAVLVLSAWRGRALVTVLAAALLVPAWVATSVADVGRFDGEGTRHHRPTGVDVALGTGADLSYELGYGSLHVDLRDLPLDPGTTSTVAVGVTAGRAHVTVPADVTVRVEGTVGLGSLDVSVPDHWIVDTEPAVNRTFGRHYPARGVSCHDTIASTGDLRQLALAAGIADADADADAVVDAIADRGFPRPTPHVEPDPWTDGPSSPEPAPEQLWAVSVTPSSWELCAPEPAPTDPAVVVIRPTIGLGTLEVDRV